jgi:GNAT superfamily N-acetyltransferase
VNSVTLPGSPLPAGPGELVPVEVRLAAPADRTGLREMFDRCSLPTRYHRFHAPVRAIPEQYLAEALSGSPFHHALVAGTGQGPGGERIVALASCCAFAEGAAELGLLIEDAWQRNGLGARLLGDLVAHASASGLRVLEAQLLAEQAWIIGALRRYGPCRSRWSHGEGRVSLRLAVTG